MHRGYSTPLMLRKWETRYVQLVSGGGIVPSRYFWAETLRWTNVLGELYERRKGWTKFTTIMYKCVGGVQWRRRAAAQSHGALTTADLPDLILGARFKVCKRFSGVETITLHNRRHVTQEVA